MARTELFWNRDGSREQPFRNWLDRHSEDGYLLNCYRIGCGPGDYLPLKLHRAFCFCFTGENPRTGHNFTNDQYCKVCSVNAEALRGHAKIKGGAAEPCYFCMRIGNARLTHRSGNGHDYVMRRESISSDLTARFRRAVEALERKVSSRARELKDENVCANLRQWLDAEDEPLRWQGRGVTPDEFFFITTLYGTMPPEGQRTMIRKFFGPLFVKAAKRDIRNFRPDLGGYHGLRSGWMKARLCKMGAVLRRRGMSMSEYVAELCALEKKATPDNPTPALDKITNDHDAAGVKTLSVFVRDCVGGNCFPIDSRVKTQLRKFKLPVDENLLVRLALAIRKNPRRLARIFYEADGW